ncbi:uncharacterized protein HMPREF1541_10526 [Cyphellophora europaea CBS 101466]|uniref:Heterokaryon incompatibility domain-containing protein n=1 Tax=Cyphellophora europaea (strain CBS 101466) TaxID=1220924 RepID=W2S6M5_CYPE1|nr:uncharacterized protein HMPREF1541_10526 [Cyphellophora europaea CBS 101466]ETN44346.1 hypothetical protein HMPREF1541_10526 [Cyphellophora europaea CBS 101466]
MFRLTADNEHNLRNGLPCSAFPNIIQEALQVVKALSIRYLWVDSLCLMQDNVQELHSEFQQMGRIYAGGSVNIAAVVGDPDHLFFSRYSVGCGPLSTLITDGSLRSESRTRILDRAHWEDGVENAALLRRGWVYQERLLARRTLFFGAQHIFWECAGGRRSELYPELCSHSDRAVFEDSSHMYSAHDKSLVPLRARLQLHKDSTHEPLSKNQQSVALRTNTWHRVLCKYTSLDLTYPDDKLHAINGVVSRYSQITGYHWIAGLWQELLPQALLWSVFRTAAPRPETSLRYPSWSWASSDGLVNDLSIFNDHLDRVVAKSVSIGCRKPQHRSDQKSLEGYIKIKASGVRLLRDSGNKALGIASNGAVWCVQSSSDRATEAIPGHPLTYTTYNTIRRCWSSACQVFPSGYTGVIIASRTTAKSLKGRANDLGNRYWGLRGLILRQIQDDRPNIHAQIFQRVGRFDLWMDHDSVPDCVRPELFSLANYGQPPEPFDFDGADYLQEYTIV